MSTSQNQTFFSAQVIHCCLLESFILNFQLMDLLPNCDVKDVASHGAGDGHVSQTFPSYNHAGDEVWDGRPCRQDGQAHDLLRNAYSLAYLRAHKNKNKNL